MFPPKLDSPPKTYRQSAEAAKPPNQRGPRGQAAPIPPQVCSARLAQIGPAGSSR